MHAAVRELDYKSTSVGSIRGCLVRDAGRTKAGRGFKMTYFLGCEDCIDFGVATKLPFARILHMRLHMLGHSGERKQNIRVLDEIAPVDAADSFGFLVSDSMVVAHAVREHCVEQLRGKPGEVHALLDRYVAGIRGIVLERRAWNLFNIVVGIVGVIGSLLLEILAGLKAFRLALLLGVALDVGSGLLLGRRLSLWFLPTALL